LLSDQVSLDGHASVAFGVDALYKFTFYLVT